MLIESRPQVVKVNKRRGRVKPDTQRTMLVTLDWAMPDVSVALVEYTKL